MAGFVQGMGLREFYQMDGVNDINPRSARGNFAKALRAEDHAGHTTQEALDFLDVAIVQIEVYEGQPSV